jgi:hypothetical protein
MTETEHNKNMTDRKEYYKQYNAENKKLRDTYAKKNYEENKEEILTKQNKKVVCERCGAYVCRQGMSRHTSTKKCMKYKPEPQKPPDTVDVKRLIPILSLSGDVIMEITANFWLDRMQKQIIDYHFPMKIYLSSYNFDLLYKDIIIEQTHIYGRVVDVNDIEHLTLIRKSFEMVPDHEESEDED